MADFHFLGLAIFISLMALPSCLVEGNFFRNMKFNIRSPRHSAFLQGDNATLVLDQYSGSGIRSNNQFLFGSFEMLIKLMPGHSAGTVTAFYLSSVGEKHDEIDFEFLGNVSGQPYIIHTNIFTQGGGGREVQFHPWFDPTADYHNYTIHWNPSHVVWYVDNIPIRVYRNYERVGIGYPKKQAMRVYSSIWDASSWATNEGDVKIDWSKAPYFARLRGFRARACNYEGPVSITQCGAATPNYWWNSPLYTKLSLHKQKQMKRVRDKFMVYDYCKDIERYKGLLPGECFNPQY